MTVFSMDSNLCLYTFMLIHARVP